MQDFAQGSDRFDLSGGSVSALTEGGGNTTLTHNGGTIIVIGVTGLTLGQWNGLTSGLAPAVPEAGLLQGVSHSPFPAWLAHTHSDFLFA